MSAYGENEDQGKSWNEKTGRSWAEHDQEMNSRLQNISDILFAEIEEKSLSNALDIGCGAGATTLRMAEKLSGRGAVTGIDISDALLTLAREKASAVDNMTFTWADAQSHRFEPAGFDGAFSRFGVMFFDDPKAAFLNVFDSLKKDSTLSFVCWQSPALNPWQSLFIEAVKKYVDLPSPPPRSPSPFAFMESEYVSSILEESNFQNINNDKFISIRPEKLKIINNNYIKSENQVILKLIINQIIFLGDVIKYICSDENQNEIILKKTRTEIENVFNIGDKIQVYFNISDGTILKN